MPAQRMRLSPPTRSQKDRGRIGIEQNSQALDPQSAREELWGMAAIAFMVSYGNSMIAPLIPALAREFGVRALDFKWLVPGFSIIYGTATLFYGALSDRFGRYPVLKILLILAAATALALSFVKSSHQLVLFRCVSAASTGGIATIALSVIGDRYPYVAQGKPMGGMFGAIVSGIGIGSSLGPLLNPVLGWRNELRILGFGFGVAALWIIPPEDRAHLQREVQSIWRYVSEYRWIAEARRGRCTLAFIFANGAFHGGIFAWLGVLLAGRYHLGEIGIGIVLASYGVPELLLGEVIGSWGDRYGRRYIVPIGFLWASICALLLALRSTPFVSAITIAGLSLGYGATHPLLSSITTSLDPRHRGQITGLVTFSNLVGVACGTLLFGRWMIPQFSLALVCFGCCEFCLGVLVFCAFRTEKPASTSLSIVEGVHRSSRAFAKDPT